MATRRINSRSFCFSFTVCQYESTVLAIAVSVCLIIHCDDDDDVLYTYGTYGSYTMHESLSRIFLQSDALIASSTVRWFAGANHDEDDIDARDTVHRTSFCSFVMWCIVIILWCCIIITSILDYFCYLFVMYTLLLCNVKRSSGMAWHCLAMNVGCYRPVRSRPHVLIRVRPYLTCYSI
jgi:hypothetical protein